MNAIDPNQVSPAQQKSEGREIRVANHVNEKCTSGRTDGQKDAEDGLVAADKLLRSGNQEPLANSYVPPPTGTTVRGQTAEPSEPSQGLLREKCSGGGYPYLAETFEDPDDNNRRNQRYNRFKWWEQSAGIPATGPIDRQFECEFNRPLATIVGGNRNDPQQLERSGYQVISWDGVDSLAEVPGVEFTIRASHFFTPDGQDKPGLEEMSVVVVEGEKPSRQKVLVNKGIPERARDEYGPGEFRSSLWIDFDKPQRAVGLAYGLRPIDDSDPRGGTGIGPRSGPSIGELPGSGDDGARLYAYDQDGKQLMDANDDRLVSDGRRADKSVSRITPNHVRHRIGVVHEDAQIHSVELRFENVNEKELPGKRIIEEQIVYQIWHEPFPPAAAKEGVFERAANGEINTKVELLPYHFDRAIVMLRGFKLKFRGQDSHPLLAIGVSLADENGGPAYFELPRTNGPRNVTFRCLGVLSPNAEQDPGHDERIYYTIFGWDSTEVELFNKSASAFHTFGEEDYRHAIVFQDRCSLTWDEVRQDLNRIHVHPECGGLFGALQHFNLNLMHPNVPFGPRPPFRPVHVALAIGRADEISAGSYETSNSAPLGFGFGGIPLISYNPPGLYRIPAGAPVLSPENALVSWNFFARFSISVGPVPPLSNGHHADVRGAVLSGRSIRLPSFPDELPFTSTKLGPRPATDEFLFGSRDFTNASYSVDADMAFVALQFFSFSEFGTDVRELEVEVSGDTYDGSAAHWKIGMGVGAGDRGEDDGRPLALPVVGAVVRHRRFELRVQDLVFQGTAGIVSPEPVSYGAIYNRGSGPVNLVSFTQGETPDAGLFDYYFLWQGQLYRSWQLDELFPLRLQPDAYLLIGGRYSPDRSAGPDVSGQGPHRGQLRFRTNSETHPDVVANAWGIAQAANPDGQWLPAVLDFGAVPPNQSKELLAVLQSTGTTPLVVNDLRVSPFSTAFSFDVPPGGRAESELLVIVVRFENESSDLLPPSIVRDLIADTNAGAIALTLRTSAFSPIAPDSN